MSSDHIKRYADLALYRAAAEFKRDISRFYLGMLWWFIEPILYMSVFYLVFGIGLRKGGPDFVYYLLTGLVVWKWLDGCVRTSSGVILGSVGLMQQVYLPKIVLPAVVVSMNTYKFLIVFFLLLLFLTLVGGISPTIHWTAVPFLLLVQFILICALSGLSAGLVPLIPDVKHIIDYGMTLLFFMSGIFFDVRDLAPDVARFLRYNPMIVLIESYRDVLLYARWPQWDGVIFIAVLSSALFVAMLFILNRFDRFYPRVIG